jgi:hypothetical protein
MLARSETATTVQRGGALIDGPIARGSIQMCGYRIVEAPDVDAAARRAIDIRANAIEVRAIR